MGNQCTNCVYYIENTIDRFDKKGRPERSLYRRCGLSGCEVKSTECCASFKNKEYYSRYIDEVLDRCFKLMKNNEKDRASFEFNHMFKNLKKELGL